MAIRITPLSMSVVVFALTLGFLMRDRILDAAMKGSHGASAEPVAATATRMPPATSGMPSGVPVVQPKAMPPAAPVQNAETQVTPVAPDMPAASPSEADASAQETPPQSVPVTMVFQPGEGPDPKEARLQNLTNMPLSVSITATEPASRSQSVAQVTIPAHRRADLLAAGLSIRAGDEVRITSPPYTDLVVTAR